eukprot:s800_g12.t1
MFEDRNKRKDLFNMWLTHAQDFGRCALEISRTNIQNRSAQATTVSWSRQQIEQSGRYSSQEIDQLLERLTREGRYMDDPNFPGVTHLRRYLVVDEVSQTNQRLQEDRQAISSHGTITHAEGINLASEGLQLKEAEEARTLNVSIEGFECSGELGKALICHANNQTEMYRKITQLVAQGVDDEATYQEHFEQAAALTTWFKARKKVANSMRMAATASSGS